MKKIVTWTLLLIYLNAAARTLLPFVQDCFAHLFFWHDHLTHVHHDHVHHDHVHEEVAKLAEQTDDPQNTAPVVLFDKEILSSHLIISSILNSKVKPVCINPLIACWRFSPQQAADEVPCPPPKRLPLA